MTYRTAEAFRRALEDHLSQQSQAAIISVMRLRKLVVFDRLLARLVVVDPNGYTSSTSTSRWPDPNALEPLWAGSRPPLCPSRPWNRAQNLTTAPSQCLSPPQAPRH